MILFLKILSPYPFNFKSLLSMQAGTSDPSNLPISKRTFFETLFVLVSLLNNFLNNINVAAASADPPPRPAPTGIFFF